MFEPSKISQLNALEKHIFDFVIKSPDKVQQMTIRELAEAVHASTAAIMRLSVKLGFAGFSELKFFLRSKENDRETFANTYQGLISLDVFWNTLSSAAFQDKLAQAVALINRSHYCLFMGLGTSSSLGNYGARYFNNLGINSFDFGDIFRPVVAGGFHDVVALVLSVSGETPEIIKKVIDLKHAGASIISITNNEKNTLTQLSDLVFSYNMLDEYAKSTLDIKLTTQLPVLAILEILAHKTNQLSKKKRQIL
ncbi:MAG: MurR/RpiR family transcriptional regulator [Streptococcaceae bacterium]|jgi:DNA-binding MurR/RpiR family transcriptional regulator|nr:MurR/RpiR family transcriptional regulator [Streptococcaceae bacterium]